MKKIYLITLFIFALTNAFAQAPEKMSYQAVIRNTANNLVVNQAVGMRISILQGTATGTAVYAERQIPTSNANGLVSLEIGTGTIISGTFATINWPSGPYFIKTETDPSGGTAYTITGTSQLLSTPYALYAKTSGSSTPGPQGTAGTNGQNTLAKTTNETAGANCTFGGVKLEYGLDANSNGTLDTAEINIALTRYICNGTQGTQGIQGTAGTNGQGVPTGGTAGQVLSKVDATDYNTQWTAAAGGGANTQLFANKVGGTAETLPLAGSTSPTTIIYNNVATNPTMGSYNNTTGVYTVGTGGAGIYLVQAKLLCGEAAPVSNTVPPYLTLIKNNTTYGSTGADIYYGDYPVLHNVLPVGLRAQGSITKVVQLAAGDTLKIVAVSANSATAAQATSTVAGSYFTIVKM